MSLLGTNELTIGRSQENGLVIPHPSVSRYHAKVFRKAGSLYIKDLGSGNGTYVNGKAITKETLLKVDDTIHIGSRRMVFTMQESLVQFDEEGNLRLDALHISKVVSGKKKVLDDISLSILPGEFVVIAGVSGGGKSTLLDALNGFRKATSGEVLVNGNSLYKNFDLYRNELGYVPQKDIVHTDLTVQQALDFAAQLRLPPDTSPIERKQRIEEVLQELGLTERRHIQISKLSGGQLKRVSIGVELLTKPSLFFLDEATSGLDPGTEADLMALLRSLAKNHNRTILLITHATDNINECDLVIFLAKGGRVAYIGPPQAATQYFGVNKFNEIYKKVEREKNPDSLKAQFHHSPFYKRYVTDRQNELPTKKFNAPGIKNQVSVNRRVSSWQQFLTLSTRNLIILGRDKASLFLMLAIAPLLGSLDFILWKKNLFDVTTGDASQIITMLFMTGLVAIMVGSMATMREIVKETDIYKRERAIGLKLMPYAFSKLLFSLILAAYQASIFLLCKQLSVNLPSPLPVTYLIILLATFAGTVMGLFVSAISPNQNVAPLITILMLVPQFLFGGGLLAVDDLGSIAKLGNQISLSKYPFESLITVTNLGSSIAADRCWQKPEHERKLYTESFKEQYCTCFGPKLFKRCSFPGLKASKDSEEFDVIEKQEPQKPKSPGAPPSDPLLLEEYQSKVRDYNNAIESWQSIYSKWKGEREALVAGAEELLSRFYKSYGKMYKINVLTHSLKLLTLIIFLFLGTIVALKIK